jgi:hypothetical protein
MRHRWKGDELEAVKKAEEYQSLRRDASMLEDAMDVARRRPEGGRLFLDAEHMRDALKAQMDELRPGLKVKVTCPHCHGSGREGHGESCGACSGGKTPAWHAAGIRAP